MTYSWKDVNVWVGPENKGEVGDEGGGDPEDPESKSSSCFRKKSGNGQASKQILNNGKSSAIIIFEDYYNAFKMLIFP